ncbi:hypothetical protein [Streptomyces ossamyceticus]|uniref:hypothetical protein n=1 Tax=Streptomyces ossamyceticus TaxID=249581 RepID=UPI0012FEDA5E|nr:hypothetical protein [Streptomyces ossamyceticus]
MLTAVAVGLDHLQRDQLPAGRAGQIHHTHAARAEPSEQPVVRELGGIGDTQRFHHFPFSRCSTRVSI